MPTLDDFFSPAVELPHPRLRDWARQLPPVIPSGSATLEIFQPRGEFGPGKPEMYVQFFEDGQPTDLVQVSWDDDLNAGLIRLKVKAVNPDQEGQRFALELRAALRKAEREFGDGYVNAVLVGLIRESDLTGYQEIADVVEFAYATPPQREGKAFDRYTICRELIADAIGGRARELKDGLAYSQEQAKQILVSALGWYLDERFSVSTRKGLGLI